MLQWAVTIGVLVGFAIPTIKPASGTRDFWRDWGTQEPDSEAIVEAVETLLQEMDPDAEEKAAELIGALGRRADRQSLRRLEKQVAGFEFEEALESIAQLRKTVFNKPGRGGS